MRPAEMLTLHQYGYWAFEKVWDCVMQLTDEQFVQDLGYSRGSIRNQVVHLMSATHRWIIRLSGRAMEPHFSFDDYPTRAATRVKWDELRTEALAYVSALTESDLDNKIDWELPARGMHARNTRWEILLQVANHATDHRAQILAMLNQHFGIQTMEQDFLFYLLEAK